MSIFDTSFGGSHDPYVETSNLAYREGDIRILIDDNYIYGEEFVYKTYGGWSVFEPHYYLFPIPLDKIFTLDEIKSFQNVTPKKIYNSTYQLLKEIDYLLFIENVDINPSQISNMRIHRLNRLERIQKQKEKISNLLIDKTSHIIECGEDDFVKSEILAEPPTEIRYFLPNHGEKRRRRRKPKL